MTWGQGTCGSIWGGHSPLPRPPRPAPRRRPPLALPTPLPAALALARCHGRGARGGRAGLGPRGGSSQSFQRSEELQKVVDDFLTVLCDTNFCPAGCCSLTLPLGQSP